MFEQATADDVGKLIGMMQEFHEFSGYSDVIPWDEESIVETTLNCISNGFVLYNEHCFIAGMYYQHPFNKNEKGCSELAMWVEPAFRSLGYGEGLLKAAIAQAKDDGCNHLVMVSLDKYPQVMKMYMANGFDKKETSFVRSL